MKDPHIEQLAKSLINYSVALKPGERVLIEITDGANPLAKELVKESYKAGGIPFLTIKNNELLREILKECTAEQLNDMMEFEIARMKKMDAYIGIRAYNNTSEMGAVPGDKMDMYTEVYFKPLHLDQCRKYTKFMIMRYPNDSMAQLAGMATQEFEDYYFSVCNFDYPKLLKAMDSLIKFMNQADRVRITGKGTDLSFSIKGLPGWKCAGTVNIPDGEVCTAPVRESVNGMITFNVPAVSQGTVFEGVG